MQLPLLYLVYIANILVAGWISFTSLFAPERARLTVFEGTVEFSDTIRLVGALWFAIFLLSCLGLLFPRQMQLVLLFQVIYKGTWLLVVALPLWRQDLPYPNGMATFFLIWVLALPWVIDWGYLFGR